MLRHLDSDLVEVVSPFNFAQAKVQLYNPAGALVKEFDTNDSQFTLSLSGLGRGVYILRLSNGSHTATQRLLH
jgi:hypothetical protein